MKLWVAAKAVIRCEGKILILREASAYTEGVHLGKYDVPGGRIEAQERLHEALSREVKEETGLEVAIRDHFYVAETFPVIKGEPWHIVRIYYACEAQAQEVLLSSDHDQFEWINPEDYIQYNVIEGDEKMYEAYLRYIQSR